MMNGFYYIRCSTPQQEPALQLNDLNSIYSGEGKPIIIKENESAWKNESKRTEFQNIIKLIRQNKISHLYVWDLDRLYRNRLRLVEFFQLCKAYGCTIHSYRQSWLEELNKVPAPWNDIMMQFLLHVLGWIGEEESSKRSSRIKNSVRKETGEKTRSYKGNSWGRKNISVQAARKILELHGQGLSTRKIADQVMITDKNNNQKNISASTVRNVIRSAAQKTTSLESGG